MLVNVEELTPYTTFFVSLLQHSAKAEFFPVNR